MIKSATEPRYAMCVKNDDCDDLEVRRVCQVLPDKRAERDGYLRIIDESGEDYVYPASHFAFVRLSRKAQRAVAVPA